MARHDIKAKYDLEHWEHWVSPLTIKQEDAEKYLLDHFNEVTMNEWLSALNSEKALVPIRKGIQDGKITDKMMIEKAYKHAIKTKKVKSNDIADFSKSEDERITEKVQEYLESFDIATAHDRDSVKKLAWMSVRIEEIQRLLHSNKNLNDVSKRTMLMKELDTLIKLRKELETSLGISLAERTKKTQGVDVVGFWRNTYDKIDDFMKEKHEEWIKELPDMKNIEILRIKTKACLGIPYQDVNLLIETIRRIDKYGNPPPGNVTNP